MERWISRLLIGCGIGDSVPVLKKINLVFFLKFCFAGKWIAIV